MHRLEAQAAVLSVAPVFDEDTGRDMLAGASGWLAGTTKGDAPEDPIQTLRLAGLLIEWGKVMRLADPIREDLRHRLAAEEPQQFRAAVDRFRVQARNGFQKELDQTLGPDAAALSLAVLDVQASPQERRAADRLVDYLQEPHPIRRRVDTIAAIRQLTATPQAQPELDRLLQFLRGLEAWRSHRRTEAATMFRRVLSQPVGDRAEAVAGHLLGVSVTARGELPQALDILAKSVSLLRRQNDERGLGMALTSQGRAKRLSAMASTTDDADRHMTDAAQALEEAAAIGRGLDDTLLEGRALLELACVTRDDGDPEDAVDVAREALELLPDASYSQLEAYTLLGSVLRDMGRVDEAGEALASAVRIARRSDVADRALARALNVQASAERRAGLTNQAIAHARESVTIGRATGNDRHTSHALHTLGAALLDRGTTDANREAEEILAEARSLMLAIGDPKGADWVAQTQERLGRTRPRDARGGP